MGRSVSWKTVTEVLKMLPEAAGRGQHFQARGSNILVVFFPYILHDSILHYRGIVVKTRVWESRCFVNLSYKGYLASWEEEGGSMLF